MSKISIITYDKKLIFDTVNFIEEKVNLNNTNVIDVETMYFSDIYIAKNMYTMTSFLNLIVAKKNIKELVIKKINIAPLVLKLTKDIPILSKVTIEEDVNINYETYEALTLAEHLKEVECFSMPPFMFDSLDHKYNKTIKLRQKEMFYSPFMKVNKLESFDEIYYCRKIIIAEKPSSTDLEDIASFFRINNRIRLIEFHYYDYNLVTTIIAYLNRNNAQNVLIKIKHIENENVISLVNQLEKSHARYFKNNKVSIKIDYKNEHKSKYFLKQFNLSLFRAILIIAIVIILLLLSVFNYKERQDAKASKKIDQVTQGIGDEMSGIQAAIDSEMDAQEAIMAAEASGTELPHDASYDIYFQKLEKVWDSLISKNEDTVGWLKVNGSKVDYPVVQAKDNIYYLNRNFYKKRNIYGWIFMDYRNKKAKMDQNTIIYGHRTNNGIMFGTLKNVLKKSWYTNPANQVISFNTTAETHNWKIFSIYTIGATDDYLYNNFYNDTQRVDFFNKLRNRSIHNFAVEVGAKDKILTLSTCYEGAEKRLVIHAKMID